MKIKISIERYAVTGRKDDLFQVALKGKEEFVKMLSEVELKALLLGMEIEAKLGLPIEIPQIPIDYRGLIHPNDIVPV